jgi:hypothetical protein
MNDNEEIEDVRPQRVFAFVTDNEVFHKWYVEEDYEDFGLASLIYGLQSQPIVVDITDKNHEEIEYGWLFDGESFYPETSGVENE